ncbi:hypothetical protein B0H13DRAFT_1992086 [Mycena leptocephala]|nr:hypothetical protein B0H13DRAFT_1992086 [Mycena leptocephala]
MRRYPITLTLLAFPLLALVTRTYTSCTSYSRRFHPFMPTPLTPWGSWSPSFRTRTVVGMMTVWMGLGFFVYR